MKTLKSQIFLTAVLLTALATLSCALDGGPGASGAAAADVDLEEVLKLYKDFVKRDSRDLRSFEGDINAKGLYKGQGRVEVREQKDGSIVGFVDRDRMSGYSPGSDMLVFKLEAERSSQRLVATDRYRRHSYIGAGDILTMWWLSSMFRGQYGYYGGYPRYDYRYQRSGYYGRTVRQGSLGRGRTRGFSGGGFRGGK